VSSRPQGALIQAVNGDLYGTTAEGGANGMGTVFKITLSGKLTTTYSFCPQSGCTDGAEPQAGLAQATNGDFYGTTLGGGASGNGAVFEITPGGKLTTLYSFCSQGVYPECADGYDPYAGLVQGTNGNFYRTTWGGGGGLYEDGRGTVFEVTQSGGLTTLTTLYNFCSESGCQDGEEPQAGLVQATNGQFYGSTTVGGFTSSTCYPNGCGMGSPVTILGNNLTGATGVTFGSLHFSRITTLCDQAISRTSGASFSSAPYVS
jgi:uncharacterized repeat protein (TIGR03803 family)